jgi:anti-anti-sigma factor
MDMAIADLGTQLTCVRLNGRLDAPGVDRIETRFTAVVVAQGKSAAIDLSGVTFLASMGIRMLVANARALGRKGGKLVLFGATEPVREVLNQAALDDLLPTVESEAQAIDRLTA